MPSPAEVRRGASLGVDRVRCSGHGICARLLPGVVELDEWGYPVVEASAPLEPRAAATAERLCPARALFRVSP